MTIRVGDVVTVKGGGPNHWLVKAIVPETAYRRGQELMLEPIGESWNKVPKFVPIGDVRLIPFEWERFP